MNYEEVIIGCIYMMYLSGIVSAMGIVSFMVEYYCENKKLIWMKAKKIAFFCMKYALLTLIPFQKKYTVKFWLKLKMKQQS